MHRVIAELRDQVADLSKEIDESNRRAQDAATEAAQAVDHGATSASDPERANLLAG
jgi:hypothetical protein